MICPLCGTRKARRGCPALGQQICAVCCGTKRLVEIRCPSDCTWLASAREHPAAAVVRQQQHDLGLIVQFMRDLNERQSQLFLLVAHLILAYEPPELQPLRDEDVAEACDALAATYETAVRGVIYDHRPASLSAERLASALKPKLAEAGTGGGTPFERDAALVLRRMADSARDARVRHGDDRRAFLDLVARVIPTRAGEERDAGRGTGDAEKPEGSGSRLILP